jgi:hypothetical protein
VRNWADRAFDVYCVVGAAVLLGLVAATLCGWPARDRFW